MTEKQKIVNFSDLEVYKRSYDASISVIKFIVPKLPDTEKYDLKDQLSRSSKAIPRLIAEGFAKKFQKKGFQKYLFDAMGESNETQVSLSQSKDLYNSDVDEQKCIDLIKEYEIIGKQLFRLKEAWDKFS